MSLLLFLRPSSPFTGFYQENVTATWNGKGVKICNYTGFTCATVPGYKMLGLTGADFHGFGFCNDKGQLTIDNFIGKLPDLVFFHANSNNITGRIPSSISTLKYFYELDLSNNKLQGTFPMTVLGATRLTVLDLRFNNLIGPLPPQVFTVDLEVLFLNKKFNGTIPENLGKTPVSDLTLANKFTGPIPRSIGQTSKSLLEVLFLNNRLSCCLPYEIGLLKKTATFDASINQLTGPIPHSFGCLQQMNQLNLSYNHLYGPVPEMVCVLPKLSALTLNNNYFTQVGPECRKLILKKKLDVRMNCILGLPSQRSPRRYVPCRISQLNAEDASKGSLTPEITLASSPSYAALNRHR
ncbi:hypothetical protein ACJRO7_034445 [Eucalyptus globulus]|uniref:Uncharacterized protein n=1 Tax=Eucalyptus globulus TaxID=34317 RepID=A0ABD3J6I9_EUCGL